MAPGVELKNPLLLKGATLIDPAAHLDTVGDVLIEDGVISSIKRSIPSTGKIISYDCRGFS